MKLEFNYKKKTGKFTSVWSLNNMLLSNQWIKEEIKGEIKKYLRQMKMEIQYTQTYGMQQKQLLEQSLLQYMPTSRSKKNLK